MQVFANCNLYFSRKKKRFCLSLLKRINSKCYFLVWWFGLGVDMNRCGLQVFTNCHFLVTFLDWVEINLSAITGIYNQ